MNDLQPVDLRSIWKGDAQQFRTYDGRICNYSMGMLGATLGLEFHQAPIAEKVAFVAYCMNNGLDPLRKQVYFIKYDPKEPAAFVTSWEVFLDRAQRHPQFDGFENGVIWLVPQPAVEGQPQRTEEVMHVVRGAPCDYLPDAKHEIIGGWAEGHRKDQSHSRRVEVPLEEMIGRRRTGEVTKFWARMLTTMTVKTPTARMLRQLLPGELQGLYIEEEVREFRDVIAPELKSGETLPAQDLDQLAAELEAGSPETAEPAAEPTSPGD